MEAPSVSSGQRPETAASPHTDAALRRFLRSELPPETLANRPWRVLWAVPLVLLITAGIAAIATLDMPVSSNR